jgi:hypothetical protein
MIVTPKAPLTLAALFADPTHAEGTQPDALRKALKGLDVGSRAWRLYVEVGDTLIEPLADGLSRVSLVIARREVAAFLRLVQAGEMDVPPPWQLVEALQQLRLPRPVCEHVPPYLFRALWKECAQRLYARKAVRSWLQQEAIPLVEWFVRSGQDATMDANRRRASWRFFEQCHKSWLYEPAHPHGRRCWPAVLRRFETGPFLVQELSTEAALYAEGEAMMHCVAAWVGDCLGDGTHVFSVRERRTGVRLATLALQADDELGWQIIELKGPRNAAVSTMVQELATMVAGWLAEFAPTDGDGRG